MKLTLKASVKQWGVEQKFTVLRNSESRAHEPYSIGKDENDDGDGAASWAMGGSDHHSLRYPKRNFFLWAILNAFTDVA